MRWAYPWNGWGWLCSRARLLMGLLIAGQNPTKPRTAYEADLMIRSGVFFLLLRSFGVIALELRPSLAKPEGVRNKKQVALGRHQLKRLTYRQGMFIFLVPLLNNLRLALTIWISVRRAQWPLSLERDSGDSSWRPGGFILGL